MGVSQITFGLKLCAGESSLVHLMDVFKIPMSLHSRAIQKEPVKSEELPIALQFLLPCECSRHRDGDIA